MNAYISCLQLKKVNVAHDALYNNYLYNHTAYYHVLQQVIAFLVQTDMIFFRVFVETISLLMDKFKSKKVASVSEA